MLAQQVVTLWSNEDLEELDRLLKDSLRYRDGLVVQRNSVEQFVEASANLGRSYYYYSMAYCNLEYDTLALEYS